MARPHPAGNTQALLGMLQLADTFFPSGLFTLSHGLETLIQTRQVQTPAELAAAVETYLLEVVAPSDATATAEALRAATAGDLALLLRVDGRLSALKLAHESRLTSQRTGRRLLTLAEGLTENPMARRFAEAVRARMTPGNYAPAFGVVASAFGLDVRQAVLAELYSFATGLLGASLRCLRIDHQQVQSVLRSLLPAIETAASVAVATPFEEMHSFAPAIEIAQMRHERAEVRLFVS